MRYINPLSALIDTDALRNNIEFVRNKFPGKKIIFPVKANAYGHGDVIVTKEAIKYGVDFFAIARLDEGLTLRSGGVQARIMSLGVERGENVMLALKSEIELSVSDFDNLEEIQRLSGELGINPPIHILFDTGMSRLGFEPADVHGIIKKLKSMPTVRVGSVFTHFVMSDENMEFTRKQIALFHKAVTAFYDAGITPELVHCSNSGGVENLEGPEWTSAVRPGIMLYGYSQKIGGCDNLIPVMTLCAEVIHTKDISGGRGVGYGHTYTSAHRTRLAAVSAGYADGLPRICSNNLKFSINGKVYKQCGRISMDLTLIEVDDSVSVGDRVYIFGNLKKASETADDIARRSGTISYEILTGIGARAERIVVNGI